MRKALKCLLDKEKCLVFQQFGCQIKRQERGGIDCIAPPSPLSDMAHNQGFDEPCVLECGAFLDSSVAWKFGHFRQPLYRNPWAAGSPRSPFGRRSSTITQSLIGETGSRQAWPLSLKGLQS